MSVDCLQPKFEYSNWYLGILNVFGIRWMMHTILAIIALNWNSYYDYTQYFVNHGYYLNIYQWNKYEETNISSLLSMIYLQKDIFCW